MLKPVRGEPELRGRLDVAGRVVHEERDFAAHGPAEVEGMLRAAGFPVPAPCYQGA